MASKHDTITTPIYSDFDLRMIPHPLTGDLNPIILEQAIKQSLRNLMYLERYDFPFDGDRFSGLKETLFENLNQLTISSLRSRIEWLVNRHEPRVKLEDIEIEEREPNGIHITLRYRILSLMRDDAFEFFAERIR